MPEENTGLPKGWGEINKEPSASEWGPSFVEEAPIATPNTLPTDSPEVFNAAKKGNNFPVKKILIGLLTVLIVGILGFVFYKFALPKLKACIIPFWPWRDIAQKIATIMIIGTTFIAKVSQNMALAPADSS